MPALSRAQKEQALRVAGITLPSYPTLATVAAAGDQRAADLALLDAGTAWERELERLYLQLLMTQAQAAPGDAGQVFVELSRREGLAAGLEQLNQRVPHRYTAVYRLQGDVLRNIELVDKVREIKPEFLAEVPLGTSFCQYVLRDGLFLTSNSAQDDRLDGHPYQGVMVAYHGVPIMDSTGALFGSLCHFDVQEQPLSDLEFEHLKAIAQVIRPLLGGAP
jgi:GAF domain-containing protein